MIYEIICNETGERYVGSTFEPTLAKRMTTHRKSKTTCISKQIIGRGNYTYGLLEKVDVSSRDELRMKEREWYDKLPNINIRRPYITEEEAIQRRKNYREYGSLIKNNGILIKNKFHYDKKQREYDEKTSFFKPI